MKKIHWLASAFAATGLAWFALNAPADAQPIFPTHLAQRDEGGIRASSLLTHTLYLPLLHAPPDPCAGIPNQTYGTVAIIPPPTDRPADQHADLNLSLRGYTSTNAARNLVTYSGGDPNAPQLASLFTPPRLPAFPSGLQVGDWDWGCNCRSGWISDPAISLLGMGTSVAEIISAPASGYDIGTRPTGYQVMVLYATTQRITLKYTREDNVVYGYTIHLENVCVEPSLLSLYNYWNAPAQGRSRLPALFAAQPLGRARGSEIRVSIRDTGTFMDPLSRLDWWHGY